MQVKWITVATVCAALVVVTFAVYWPVLSCDFVSFDDDEYVFENRNVLAGLSWSGWCYAWTTWDCANWHPLTWLSLELDGCFWGSNSTGYHATNLLLHVINSVLVFVVLRQLTNSVYRSACVAAFFALHPLHVESVAWVSERKDVLSTLFLLLTILAYIRYATRPSAMRYLPVMFLLALGLLAKPMLVTLPILLLILDAWPLERIEWARTPVEKARFPRRSLRAVLIEKVPLLSLALADGLTTVFAQHVQAQSLTDVTFDTRVANLFHSYFWYLQKTFLPINLTILYPHPERDLSWTQVGIGFFIFVAVSMFALWQRKNRPHILFGWSWFIISLAPVIGLVQVGYQAYADRYVYIPHIGLLIAIVWEFHARLVSLKCERVVGGLVVLTALALCGTLTRIQLRYWANSETLWSHALEVNPANGPAYAHLATIRLAEGDYERALDLIERGMRLKRTGKVAGGYCAWGLALVGLNRPEEAELKFLEALKHDRNHEKSLDELVKLLQKQKRYAEAARFSEHHQRIMLWKAEKQPDTAASQLDLGISQARQGNVKQAISHFERAVRLAPELAPARFNLAYAQKQLGRHQDAKANLIKVLEVDPNMAVAHFHLAKILEDEGDLSGAKKHFAEAIRINPSDVASRQSLDRLSPPNASLENGLTNRPNKPTGE